MRTCSLLGLITRRYLKVYRSYSRKAEFEQLHITLYAYMLHESVQLAVNK